MKSIRAFLLSRLLVGTALILVLAGVLLFVVVTRALERQFDRNLADRVQGFASILFQVENRVMLEFSEQLMPEYESEERPEYFQLWLEDGRLFERSESLGDEDLELVGEPGESATLWSAPLPDGRSGRYVSRLVPIHHVRPEDGPDRPEPARVVIALAKGREELVRAERGVLIGCAGFSFTLLVLLGLLVRGTVRRALVPANELAATLDGVHVEHLPERLEHGPMPLELASVAAKSDALVQRLGVALERERRTTADIAHELRTPISEMMTVSEVALRAPSLAEPAKKALRTLRDVAWRMGRSVSTLLKLARLEMGAESFSHQAVDLDPIVRELRRGLASIERERALDVVALLGEDSVVEADEDVLRIIVSNLVSNALYYSPPRGVVRLLFERTSARWELRVENTASELRQSDLGALTRPFWRKDEARANRDRSGLGLGLSRGLAEQSGLELRFALEGQTFRATLAGPLSAGASDPNPSSPPQASARARTDPPATVPTREVG